MAIARAPEAGEVVDPETGEIVLDHALKADMESDPREVRRLHALKAAEAALVLSGYTLTAGMLYDEAAALGITIDELAGQVISAGEADRERECARRVLKTGGE